MAKNKQIKRQIQLEQVDFDILRKYALEKGLGGKWLSAATRLVIREWDSQQKQNHKDNPSTG